MSLLILAFALTLLAALGWTSLDVYRSRHGSVRHLATVLAHTLLRLWRETDAANRRLVELQQPWRHDLR